MVLLPTPSYVKDGCHYDLPTLLKSLDESAAAIAVRDFLKAHLTESLQQLPHIVSRPDVSPSYGWVISMALPLADKATPAELEGMLWELE
jgi:hypothetical protein